MDGRIEVTVLQKDELLQRLDVYKKKKQDEKLKRVKEIQTEDAKRKKINETKKNVLKKNNGPVGPIQSKIGNKPEDKLAMREKLEAWRCTKSKKEKENVKEKVNNEDRKTAGWAALGKCEIPKLPNDHQITNVRRKTFAAQTTTNAEKNILRNKSTLVTKSAVKSKSSLNYKATKLPTERNLKGQKLPSNMNVQEKRVPEKMEMSAAKRVKRSSSVASSTPSLKQTSPALPTAAFSTLSAIKSVSASLKKLQPTSNCAVNNEPKSRKSLFGERARTKTVGRPDMLPLPKTPKAAVQKFLPLPKTPKLMSQKSAVSHNINQKTQATSSSSSLNNKIPTTAEPQKMQVKKFRYVSSRIDTGLKKPMAEQIKSTGTKKQRETAVCVKMTKTAAQRMNNQNDINKLGSKPYTKVGRNVMNRQDRTYTLSAVNPTKQVGNKRENVTTKVTGSISSESGLGNRLVRPHTMKRRNSSSNSLSSIAETEGIKIRKIDGNSAVRKTCFASKRLVSDSDNEAISGTGTRPVGRRDISQSKIHVHFLTPTSIAATPAKKLYAKTPVKVTPNTAQNREMRARLDDWLQSKGKTPSKFMHLMCFQDDKVCESNLDGGLSVNELHLQQQQLEREEESNDRVFEDSITSLPQTPQANNKVNNLLNECLLLLQCGCPTENVSAWINEIRSTHPTVLKEAKYYIVMSHLAEQKKASDAEIIDIYEEAVRNNATPPEEVANALQEFVTRMNMKQQDKADNNNDDNDLVTPLKTPRRSTRLSVQEENIISLSTTKYSFSKSTPFFTRLRAKADGLPTPCGVVTPVRRSTRLSKTPLPVALMDHDTVVESLDEFSPDTRHNMLFQPNKALIDEFEEVMDLE